MSTTTQRRTRRRSIAGLVAGATALSAVGLGVLGAGPANADTVTASDGATATVSDVVATGNAIHIDGTGWKHPSNGTGSTIGIKLGDALTTEPASGPVTNPATGQPATGLGLWAAVEAEDDGSFSADITFPTPTNTNPALPSAWAVGTTHTLRLLSGSMESGDQPRSVLLTFTVGEGLVSSAATATTGIVTVSLSGGQFPVGEVLSVKQGDTPRQWTVTSGRTSTVSDTYTVPAAGTVTARVVLPAGSATAGEVTLTITGDQGSRQTVTTVAPPSVAFGNGTALGASGDLTIGNLKPGATISSVKLGDTTLASNLTADPSGNATVAYSIPGDIRPVTYPLVIEQTAPSAQTYTLSQAVYPDETPVNTAKFALTSTTAEQGFYQGFYQSAYSAAEDALYVTASDRGTGNNGYIYKLDPDTLAIEASYNTVDHDGFTRTGAFGIGVDDDHGNVWVTNTGSASVAIYRESDLSLVKQFPANTITHPRDAVYDAETGQVFVSSASEGSSATASGYISVFEADDKDGDGTPYEKITDIQTGTRDVFNPVSLALGDGRVFSPSLGSAKVVSIDTDTLEWKYLTVDGIDVGGRGASGIAYDAADDELFIASQNSHEVVIADATTGETIKEVPTGRGALNVAYDDVRNLAYVTNFGGTSVTVLDGDGNLVAALPIATANHVSLDGQGNAYVVDKATPTNKVWKISPTWVNVLGTEVDDPTSTGVTAQPGTTPLSVTVKEGEAIHLDGEFFTHPNGTGSTIAVKLDSGGATPATGPVTNPITGNPQPGVYDIVEADDTGSWSVDLPFPSEDAVNDPSLAWGVGDTHHLRLLTGSLEPGDTIRTLAINVTVEPADPTAGTPTISGTAQVGKKLTAEPGTWADGTTFTYQWQRAGRDIARATKATYTPVAADAGKKLTVVVTGTTAGNEQSVTSAPTGTVKKGVLKSAKPKIAGQAKVGKKLTAKPGSWTSGTKLRYQWKVNGKAIKGAKGKTLKLKAAQKGKGITVTVTGTKAGYATTSVTSAAKKVKK